VAFLAVRLIVVLREGATSQGIHAESAHKVLGVPLLVEGIHASSGYRLTTSSTQRAALLMVMNLAVRLSSILKEHAVTEILAAVSTYEMLGMPLLTQGVNAITFHRKLARSTLGGEQVKEIILTVRSTVTFEERCRAEGFQAVSADKMIRVPFPSKGSDAAIDNGTVAVCTLGTIHSLIASLAEWLPVVFIECARA